MGYTLYVHTNKTNGKKYVGITSRQVEKRWGSNGINYRPDKGDKPNRRFWNAIKKYGWDNFDHEIIIEGLTAEQAIEYEKFYILHFNSYKNGYNSTYGGDGAFGHKQSAATRRKMSMVRKGKKHSAEWSRHISESQMIKRKVICLETGIIYDSPRDCASKMGLNYISIMAVCKDDRVNKAARLLLTVHGYHFQYADTPIKTIEEMESSRRDKHRSKPVLCFETGERYSSAISCARENGMSRTSVERACKTHFAVFGKHYKYEQDEITFDEVLALEKKREELKSIRNKKIRCVEDGKVFDDQIKCGEFYGISSSYINMICMGKEKSGYGLHFEYVI